MRTFTLKDNGNVDEMRIQLHKDGFELVKTLPDGTEVFNQVNPPKEKPWTAMDQYKETKALLRKQYAYGISAGMGRGVNLTDWLKA